jgi:hypothetical protein
MPWELTVPHDRSQLYFFLHAFISGTFAYALYGLLVSLAGLGSNRGASVHFLGTFLDAKQPIALSEVIWTCVIAVGNGFALSAAINRKYLNRLARLMGATKKFGDLDVWGYLNNSPLDSLRWVRIRDHRHDLCYEGYIEAFSDTTSPNELFLRDVRIYKNESAEFLYSVPGIYLTQDPQDVALEFYALSMRESQPEAEGSDGQTDQARTSSRKWKEVGNDSNS